MGIGYDGPFDDLVSAFANVENLLFFKHDVHARTEQAKELFTAELLSVLWRPQESLVFLQDLVQRCVHLKPVC